MSGRAIALIVILALLGVFGTAGTLAAFGVLDALLDLFVAITHNLPGVNP